jgi:hypothetical protein
MDFKTSLNFLYTSLEDYLYCICFNKIIAICKFSFNFLQKSITMTVEPTQAFNNLTFLSKEQLYIELLKKFGNSYGYKRHESSIVLTRHGDTPIVNINFRTDQIQVLAVNPRIRTNEETVPVFELVKQLAC